MSTDTPVRRRLDLRAYARREWYLTRLDWHLRNVSGKDNRKIRRDLRAEITDAALDVGIRAALTDLGTPAALAQRYTGELAPEGPRYGTGVFAAGATAIVLMWLLLAYAIGTLDTLAATGGGTRTTHPAGTTVVFTSTSDEISMEATHTLPLVLVILAACLLTYILAARLWRLHRPKNATPRTAEP